MCACVVTFESWQSYIQRLVIDSSVDLSVSAGLLLTINYRKRHCLNLIYLIIIII